MRITYRCQKRNTPLSLSCSGNSAVRMGVFFHRTTLFLLFSLMSPVFGSTPVLGRSSLRGKHLHGCVLVEVPYVYADENRRCGFNGVAIEYLDRLQHNLEFYFDLDLWNGTWKSFIDHMAKCDPEGDGNNTCLCDIGVGSFTMTSERVDRVTFVWAFGHENYRMVMRKSELRVDDSQNTWFVFKTFSTQVWAIIVLGIVMHAIGTVFFGPFLPSPDKLPSGGIPATRHRCSVIWRYLKRFPAAVLFAYAHLIGHPFGERGDRTPSFHRTAWLVLGLTSGLFLLTVYEASLTVLLFESTRTSRFHSLQDLSRGCGISPEKVAMVKDSASQEFWNFAINTTAHRDTCGWNKAGITVNNLEEGFRYIKDRKADYFYDLEGSVLFRAHRNCDLYEPVGEPFFSTSVGFVLPKKKADSDLYKVLSRETRILRETDAFDSATVVALRSQCDSIVDATITSSKLTAFFVMYISAWSLLLVYRLLFLWRRKQDMREPTPLALEMDTVSGLGAGVVVMNVRSMSTRDISTVTQENHSMEVGHVP